LADFLCRREAIRAHWFFPYFITAALRISSLKTWEIKAINSEFITIDRLTNIRRYILMLGNI